MTDIDTSSINPPDEYEKRKLESCPEDFYICPCGSKIFRVRRLEYGGYLSIVIICPNCSKASILNFQDIA